jgi:uncharacterized protein with HEPN domain
MKRDSDYIEHILDCADWIQQFIQEGKQLFIVDRKTHSATLRELQTLAESTQRLSTELKQRHPEIQWDSIAGLRNILVHDYFGINSETVLNIITNDLPHLITVLTEEQNKNP